MKNAMVPLFDCIAINCLMYADAVIIISESEQGLHDCLRRLEKFVIYGV